MKDKRIEEIGREMAKRLGGAWTYREDEHGEACYVECRDGRGMHLRGVDTKRVRISAHEWPSYTERARGGFHNGGSETSKERVTPSNVREESPSITVAMERGADAVCKEIARRFMPEYNRVYALCLASAQASQASQDARAETWARYCEAAGADKSKGWAKWIGGLDVTPSSGDSVYLERGGSIPVDDAIVALKAVMAYRATKKGKADA